MAIPTADLSPFFTDGDEDGKNKAKRIIKDACSEYGFFQIVNHGVPVDLMSRAMELSKKFFASGDDEKAKCRPSGSAAPLPVGYSKQPEISADKNEYLLMYPPHSGLNVLPTIFLGNHLNCATLGFILLLISFSKFNSDILSFNFHNFDLFWCYSCCLIF
ncbi:hypothetical protein F511_02223 [Dorcoceras hygrometricum]|uniref:Non-haem dioxygenase N-terminal domain-containing protein n=1 Tax=Dorcoceras hygrometricum TaxID=472368 RepID=A0A2Z7AVR5_9LAMI|nr:hypothetical protein F511_02223 [Dorcoceras hygrometricum]